MSIHTTQHNHRTVDKIKRGTMNKSKGGAEDGGVSTRTRISDLPEGLLRPNLDLSETTFEGNKQEFISAVDKTLQRYCDPNGLLLEEFNLTVKLRHQAHQGSVVSLLDKWIPIIFTTGMGVALKEFRLSIISKTRLCIVNNRACLVYPVYDLIIDDLPVQNKNLPFERLQVLSLQKVLIKQETFDRIISSCILLTTVWLEDCRGLKSIKLEKKLYNHLKHFTFIGDTIHLEDETPAEIEIDETAAEIEIDDVPTLETIKIVGTEVQLHVGGHKFTNLKSLTLRLTYSKRLSVETEEICIDAPNLLYFKYSGSVIPSISFAPNCSRSNITLVNSDYRCIDALSWLLKISQLLQALCHSEISLNIHQTHRDFDSVCIPQPDFVINGCNKPVVVKHLRFCDFEILSLSSALNGLLCICRPRNITQRFVRPYYLSTEILEKEIKEYLRNILIVRGSGNQEIRQDLKAVSIQRLERFDKCKRWQQIPLTACLEYRPLNPIRFQLKWSEACHSSSKLHKLVKVLDN